MKITFDVPDRTGAVVITILVDNFTKMQMRTLTVATTALKEGAQFDMISAEPPKEEEK